MEKIGIIGGGVFGLSCALELAKSGFKVTVFEKGNKILPEASSINHLRHHLGYHYPRSPETVEEIHRGLKSFEAEFKDCVDEDVISYYAVCKEGSKTTPEDFIKFCKKFSLPYDYEYPAEDIINRSKVDLCIKAKEPVYSPIKLRELMIQKLNEQDIKLNLNTEIVKGDCNLPKKLLITNKNNIVENNEFDSIVNATYSNINDVNKLIGLPTRVIQYELMEMVELKLPIPDRLALTLVDGEFSSIMPRDTGTHALAQVNSSVLDRIISDRSHPDILPSAGISKSNLRATMQDAISVYPFLKKAKIIRPLYVTKVVEAFVEKSDARLCKLTDYKNNCYSVFGGKVLGCIEMAKKLTEAIKKDRILEQEPQKSFINTTSPIS